MSAKQTPESFWRRVLVGEPESCWEWVGAKNSTGYGSVSWNGRIHVAHRVAAWLAGLVPVLEAPKDPLEPGFVLHKCDNRKCCNPEHFFIGTHSDNQLDAYAKSRRSQPKGERHVNSKLTNAQAMDIRAAYAKGARQVDLAEQFGVSQVAISLIIRNKTYICQH